MEDYYKFARLAHNHNAQREIDKALGFWPEPIKTEFDFKMEEHERARQIRERRETQEQIQRDIERYAEELKILNPSKSEPMISSIPDIIIVNGVKYRRER